MALTTALMSTLRGRPPVLAAGIAEANEVAAYYEG
jgi:hypothetical protein